MEPLRNLLVSWLEKTDSRNRAKERVPAGTVFARVGDACGIGSVLVTSWFFFFGRSASAVIMASALVTLTLVFIVLNFDLRYRYAREARRARAMPHLAASNAHLTSAAVAIGRQDQSKFAADFTFATASLAEAFEVATGYECRVSVMDLGAGDDLMEGRVKVLCRNKPARVGTRESKLPEYAVIKDNSDYLSIMQGEPVFFSNDLMKEHGYKNSHFEYPMEEKDYPYRSTIVWPIAGPDVDPAVTELQIIGFLGVDSTHTRAFDRWLDVPSGEAIASAMYASLSVYREQVESSNASGAPTLTGSDS